MDKSDKLLPIMRFRHLKTKESKKVISWKILRSVFEPFLGLSAPIFFPIVTI